MGFEAAERMGARVEDYRSAAWRSVSPGYFATLGIPLKRGRVFDDSDAWPAPQTVIISEALARLAWPGEDPLDHELAISNGSKLRVVGVVGDARHLVLDSLPGPTMYFSHRQFPWPQMWLTVRTTGDPAALGDAMRRELAAIDPLVPVANLRPLTAFVADTAAEPRLTMLIFAIFATAAIVLVTVGLYGIISYSVAQRTREIGVSIALGALPGRIVRNVMGQGTRLAVAGVAMGSAVALAVTGVLRSFLYETAPNDPLTYAAVALLLITVAALASAGPARRAAHVDPVEALRNE
jgi:putative ABC transport system permease protein